MYLVEKIGKLILITMEDLAADQEVETIKKELKEIIDKENKDDADEELVVSVSAKPAEGEELTPEMKKYILDIVEFCEKNELRIYSYSY
jgi:hypothetical protein